MKTASKKNIRHRVRRYSEKEEREKGEGKAAERKCEGEIDKGTTRK